MNIDDNHCSAFLAMITDIDNERRSARYHINKDYCQGGVYDPAMFSVRNTDPETQLAVVQKYIR